MSRVTDLFEKYQEKAEIYNMFSSIEKHKKEIALESLIELIGLREDIQALTKALEKSTKVEAPKKETKVEAFK